MEKKLVERGDILKIYVDGASRKNPGPAACAFIFMLEDNIIHEKRKFLGEATNNIAEYNAIIEALSEAEKFTRGEVEVFSDSELVVKQINKVYRVKKEHLAKLRSKVYSVLAKFTKVDFKNVGRDNKYIGICDKLCNQTLDEHGY